MKKLLRQKSVICFDMKNSNVEMSVDEIIATLQRTRLPTLVVEGRDDLIVYRRIETILGHLGVSVLPAGGRKNVLQVFCRMGEIPSAVKVAFVADQDIWVNTIVPTEFQNQRLILTNGYSLENDVIRDGNLLALLTPSETANFNADLTTFVHWYALALSRHLNDCEVSIAYHPNHILNAIEYANFIKLNLGENYPLAINQALMENYTQLLRGKSLMGLLLRQTNCLGRIPKHNDNALLEMVSINPGQHLARIVQMASEVLK